jgi:Mg2+ and Co2+ transporter CorA
MEQIVESMIKPVDKWGEEQETKTFLFSAATREYIRDVASNVDRIVDLLDTYKELCASVTEIYTNEQDHRNNQTMYALSIISAVNNYGAKRFLILMIRSFCH